MCAFRVFLWRSIGTLRFQENSHGIKLNKGFHFRRDWRKSGLRDYLCPPFQDIDIEDKFDELWQLQNTTYYDISDQVITLGPTTTACQTRF